MNITEEEYICTITRLAAEAFRIKDNKPWYAKKEVENRLNDAKNTTNETPLPESIFANVLTNGDYLISLLGRKWRESILPILSLVELFKNRTSTKEITVLYLPTSSRYLTDVFGSPMNVSRTIKKCVKVGLLKCVNENYRFAGETTYSKLYAWNKEMERTILAFCKEHGIKAEIPRSLTMKKALEEFGKNDGWKKKAEGFIIKIAQRTALPKTLTDEEVVDALLERYPEIREAMETAVELNRNLPESEQISVLPRINRSKSGTITKIGFRITNPIVSAKVHDNQNDDYHGIWLKRDVLEPVLGSWVEYDVKSSIYRVAHLLKTGLWLPDTVDLYERISGFKFRNENDRRNFKLLCMSLYFENSPKSLVAHYEAKGMEEDDKDGLLESIERAMGRMGDICGESLRSEIFVAESCIYLEAFRRMRERGWRVIQVYDGFYIQTSIRELKGRQMLQDAARKIVEESAYWYFDRYFKGEQK